MREGVWASWGLALLGNDLGWLASLFKRYYLQRWEHALTRPKKNILLIKSRCHPGYSTLWLLCKKGRPCPKQHTILIKISWKMVIAGGEDHGPPSCLITCPLEKNTLLIKISLFQGGQAMGHRKEEYQHRKRGLQPLPCTQQSKIKTIFSHF